MSSIIARPYDPDNKINRAIFRGSPNLLTTSDLNRQLEALKAQLDMLDDKTGAVSDISLSITWVQVLGQEQLLQVHVESITMFYCKGANFSPDISDIFQIASPVYDTKYYFCLVASQETVTHASDPTHIIAGASFENGTSQESADQLVYTDEMLVLVDDAGLLAIVESSDTVLIAILVTIIKPTSLDDVQIVKNFITPGESLKTNLSLDTLYVPSKDDLEVGMSYQEALCVLYKRIIVDNLVPAWQDATINRGSYTHNIKWRILNGYLDVMLSNSLRADIGEGDWIYTITGIEEYILGKTGKTIVGMYGTNTGFGAVKPAIVQVRPNDLGTQNYDVGSISLEIVSNTPKLWLREIDEAGLISSGYVTMHIDKPVIISMSIK